MPRRSSFWGNGWQVILLVLASALFASIIFVVHLTTWALAESRKGQPLGDHLKSDMSITLGVIRVLQGLLSAVTTFAISRALQFLQWGLICRPKGLAYLSLVSLSQLTADWGRLRIILSPRLKISSRMFAVGSILLLFVPWLSDLLLYVRTSFVTVFDTAHIFNSTAGLGSFNASLVRPFIQQLNSLSPGYPYQVLPFSVYAVVYQLVGNPWISTVMQPTRCTGDACESYLLSGGGLLMEPSVPPGYTSNPLVRIEHIPTIQLEYTPILNPAAHSEAPLFADSECNIFGNASVLIAVRLCIARSSPPTPESLNAGLYVCLNGIDPLQPNRCRQSIPDSPDENEPTTDAMPNITTTFTLAARTATITFAQSNLSITNVDDLSPPTPILLTDADLRSYREALAFLLNFTAANIPAPSSVIESFWSGSSQLTYGPLSQGFQSILAFPIWFFNANNLGNLDMWGKRRTETLPKQFFTRTSIVTPYVKMKFDDTMLVVYIVLQGSVLVLLWVLLVWSWSGLRGGSDSDETRKGRGGMPAISSYPLFDIAFKTGIVVGDSAVDEESGSGSGNSGMGMRMRGERVWNAQDAEILRMMRGCSVTVKRD